MEKINWKTFAGDYIPVKEMTNTHIINTYNCLSNYSKTIIPQNWCGRTHQQWKYIFEKELYLRGYEIHLSNSLQSLSSFKYIIQKID